MLLTLGHYLVYYPPQEIVGSNVPRSLNRNLLYLLSLYTFILFRLSLKPQHGPLGQRIYKPRGEERSGHHNERLLGVLGNDVVEIAVHGGVCHKPLAIYTMLGCFCSTPHGDRLGLSTWIWNGRHRVGRVLPIWAVNGASVFFAATSVRGFLTTRTIHYGTKQTRTTVVHAKMSLKTRKKRSYPLFS